jgi:hypothetical protein
VEGEHARGYEGNGDHEGFGGGSGRGGRWGKHAHVAGRRAPQALPTWTRFSAPPIRTPREGVGTVLPMILLGSKPRRFIIGRTGVSPILAPTPKWLSGVLLGSSAEML